MSDFSSPASRDLRVDPTFAKDETTKAEAPPASSPSDPNGFAVHLVKHLIGREGYQMGTHPEAQALMTASDFVLTRAGMYGLELMCLIDRVANPDRLFELPAEEAERIGKACLKYSGTVNRAQMPVVIRLVEINDQLATPEQKQRLAAFKRSSRFSKVHLSAGAIDEVGRTVWPASNALAKLFGGNSLERLLRKLSLSEAELAQDFEASSARLRAAAGPPIFTYGVLLLLAAVFAAEQSLQIDAGPGGFGGLGVRTLAALGGLDRSLVVGGGDWYRLLSAIFLHANAWHLLLNGVSLFFVGKVLENLIGRWWFLTVFFVGGICGSLMSIAVNPPNQISVGASGAIMALFTTALVGTGRMPWGPERQRAQILLAQMLVPAVIPLFSFRSGTNVDYAGHIGGAISGLMLGVMLRFLWPRNQLQPGFTKLAIGLAVVGLLASLSILWPVGRQHQYWVAAGRLISADQLPKTEAEGKARSVQLVTLFPDDPRSHVYRAMALLDVRQTAGAEAQLRTALANLSSLRGMLGPAVDLHLHLLLALVLAEEGKRDEALLEAKDVCKSQFAEGRVALLERGLCPAEVPHRGASAGPQKYAD